VSIYLKLSWLSVFAMLTCSPRFSVGRILEKLLEISRPGVPLGPGLESSHADVALINIRSVSEILFGRPLLPTSSKCLSFDFLPRKKPELVESPSSKTSKRTLQHCFCLLTNQSASQPTDESLDVALPIPDEDKALLSFCQSLVRRRF
jgi:hypothetical protein